MGSLKGMINPESPAALAKLQACELMEAEGFFSRGFRVF